MQQGIAQKATVSFQGKEWSWKQSKEKFNIVNY